jgi:hypothetical protein
LTHFLGFAVRSIIDMRMKLERRNPKTSKKKAKTHKATMTMNCVEKFPHPKDPPISSFRDLTFSSAKMINERQRRRIEDRNPMNPGPGALKLPTPSFRLEVMIKTQKPMKKRLLIRFNHFISAPFFPSS